MIGMDGERIGSIDCNAPGTGAYPEVVSTDDNKVVGLTAAAREKPVVEVLGAPTQCPLRIEGVARALADFDICGDACQFADVKPFDPNS